MLEFQSRPVSAGGGFYEGPDAGFWRAVWSGVTNRTEKLPSGQRIVSSDAWEDWTSGSLP
jgi:hypothetical protein